MSDIRTQNNHVIIYASSYDRGLIHLLKMWPEIRKEVPDATLHIAYGWDLFDKGYANNPERMKWKDKMNELMSQKGITHHGRIGKKELRELRLSSNIWAYPTDFDEINCITALEMQYNGVVPVVIEKAALKETVQSGGKIVGDIYDPQVRAEYLDVLLKILKEEDLTPRMETAHEFAKDFSWEKIADEWAKYF